ncbi:MAG: NAD(P)H dehydrogenase [Ponticaulis sp.]|nr:NAD(P)H dehydrogenase [Ponticaulis sp.]|tara:strand:- start:21326 stop:21910 length:585 start_codon:yes stop_codon:yes gene_type:complete
MSKICVIHGHPDTSQPHFCRALGDAYIEGAKSAGHNVDEIVIGDLEFDFMRRPDDFETVPPANIAAERNKIGSADHVVIIFPLWLGGAPSILKAFFEHAARGGYFLEEANSEREFPKARMKGKSMRIIVTMGMPSLIYNTWFGANSLKGLEKGMFGISGFSPIRHKLIGTVETKSQAKHEKWLNAVRQLGERAV